MTMYNDTYTPLSVLTPKSNSAEVDTVLMQFFNYSQLVITILGFIANTLTVVTLSMNGKGFSSTVLLLLCHQSIFDALACAMAAILLVQPVMWVPGYDYIDALICYIWNGNGLYWSIVFVSMYNLVCLAYERFLAVCRPFEHVHFTRRSLRRIFIVMYIFSIICTIGAYLHTRLVDGKCESMYFLDGEAVDTFFEFFSISTFFTFYTIPCIFFVVFYGMVIATFKRRKRSTLSTSRVIDKASAELTKTAIIVTCIFIVTIGYDSVYYTLGHHSIVEYVVNTPKQLVGIWLSSFNSVANPFVYGILMPSYRQSIKRTFFPHSIQVQDKDNKSISVSNTNT